MDQNIDKTNFVGTIMVILLVSVPLIIAPEAGAKIIQECYDFIASQFGVLYLLSGCAALLLLVWLAFSRYGGITLGDENEPPEFSTYSWIGMLFCAGIGAGLMYWASIEWAYYYQSPPFGAEPLSVEAAKWASSYGVFHWGVTAWAFYCLPTIAIAYPYYVKKIPILKFSLSLHYFFKGKEDHIGARFVDFLFMIALIGGAGSSLGFSTPLIAALISRLTGIETGIELEIFVVSICVVLFAISVWLGIKKGIKRLSDFNLLLALILVAYVLFAGPTLFLLKTALNSVGTVVQNFVQMNTWTDPFTDSGFVEDWTVFYWAWWIAYGPFVGLFVTRISRGRTIREVIVGMLTYGSLGAALFYLTLGNFSLYQELTGQVAVLDILNNQGGNQAIIASFDQLPMAELIIGLFCVVSVIFSATTYDSASYILASNATKKLSPSEDPPRWHRAFWSFALAILPITLMYIGGLKVAQTAVLVVSLPILVVGIFMSYALVKTLKEDHG
ncbi:MAG TPA: BCCT family transporter [Porticoccus sp.]|nr:BCCT family transporter [Porticoccus sp.]